MTEAEPTPLTEPRDGLPAVITTPSGLRAAADALAVGTGPVAVDAERASGYRYGQAVYLVQLRRAGAKTWLIDPVGCPDLALIQGALADTEWVLHAASQDLPCLAEVGLRPSRIFDTELAARLAGLPRVGLGAVVEHFLGLSLAKEHSAVDWSTRPLPPAWLRYAALDVEVLIELRTALHDLLAEQGKLAWAEQEFAAIAQAPPTTPRVDPWRRTSGLHRLRSRRQLALVRELWQARDQIARSRDVAAGRIVSDLALVAAVTTGPRTMVELSAITGFSGPGGRRYGQVWLDALARAQSLPESELPPHTLASDAPPPPRAWPDRDREAAARLSFARTALAELSEKLAIPVENLLTPDTLRRVLWQPPTDLAAELARLRARPWQIALTRSILAEALTQTAGAEVPAAEPNLG